MLNATEELGRRAAERLRAIFSDHDLPASLPIVQATKPEFGDLQCSAALALSKSLKRPPREIAAQIAAALAESPSVARTEIAGPGFVNIHLDDAWLAHEVERGPLLRDIGHGQRVVVDYSSPNVAKPMHIGHIRSTILGDALQRILRAVGYEVISDNHLGDWGTQFGKLIVAYKRWLDPEAFAREPVAELLRLYVKYTEEEEREAGHKSDEEADVKDAPPILREARAELVKLQQGDAENVALWKRFIAVSMSEFEAIYRRLGVTFDVILGESFYNDRLEATVARLQKEGIAEESRGALVVFFTKERDGEEMAPFLVRKADGGFNYGTTDVAAVLYRIDTWQPARILILTDERQQLHFRQLFATAHRLGVTCSLEHIWFGLMRLPEGTISTRKGRGLIYLEDLLDEAERRALEVAREHNPELTEEELREVARAVGIGAVKYNDLSRDRQSLVTFTWDKALSLQGNTAPYLQYAYARMRSILRKGSSLGATPGAVGPLSPVERSLVTRLLWLSATVEEVARTARPHLLADYLYELAAAFSAFYTVEPVLKAEPAVRASRLRLTELTAQTLGRGLGLLGIEVLERM